MKKILFSTVMAAAITFSASAAFAQLTPVAPAATKPAVAAPAAPTVAKPAVPAAVKETKAVAAETKDTKPASEAQLKQRAKMKECGAKWQEMKKTGANKGTSWKEFSPKCLKGEA